MLKNLAVYAFNTPFRISAGDLEAKLAGRPLTSPTALSLSSSGWLPFTPGGARVLCFEDHLLFLYGREDKIIPPAAVNREVKLKVDEHVERNGFKPGRKQVRQFKEAILVEMAAKALIKLVTVPIWIDLKNQRLVVDAASPKKAEEVINLLRDTLGSVPVRPIATEHGPMACMTTWLHGSAPAPFDLGYSLDLSAPDASGQKVKFTKHQIEGCPEVASHLKKGLCASSVELWLGENVSFKVNERLQIKGVKIQVDEDQQQEGDSPDPDASFEATMRIGVDAWTRIIDGLIKVFGGLTASDFGEELGEQTADEEEEADA